MSVRTKLLDEEGCGDALAVTITAGDRVALVVRVDARKSEADAARLEAWRGEEWLAQVRRTPGADDVVATFDVTETVDDSDEAGDVLTLTFVVDDTVDWSGEYAFDFRIISGDISPYTYFPGSRIYVGPATSRDGGS